MFEFRFDPSFNFGITIGQFLTFLIGLIGLIVGVYQFNKQMKANRTQHYNLWYQDLLIKPELEHLNSFYRDLIRNVSASKRKIMRCQRMLIFFSHTVVIADEQEKINSFIDKFYLHFAASIASFNSKTAGEIKERSKDLYDICSVYLSNTDLSAEKNTYVKILGNKTEVLIILQNAILGGKQSLEDNGNKKGSIEKDTSSDVEQKQNKL